jgi:hypothetical protein
MFLGTVRNVVLLCITQTRDNRRTNKNAAGFRARRLDNSGAVPGKQGQMGCLNTSPTAQVKGKFLP